MKQVPGADSVEMVYDQWDRLVLTRDGNHSGNGGTTNPRANTIDYRVNSQVHIESEVVLMRRVQKMFLKTV